MQPLSWYFRFGPEGIGVGFLTLISKAIRHALSDPMFQTRDHLPFLSIVCTFPCRWGYLHHCLSPLNIPVSTVKSNSLSCFNPMIFLFSQEEFSLFVSSYTYLCFTHNMPVVKYIIDILWLLFYIFYYNFMYFCIFIVLTPLQKLESLQEGPQIFVDGS